MLINWLNHSVRQPCDYSKFTVTDLAELAPLDFTEAENQTIGYLSQLVLLAHGNPQMIMDDCKMLMEDAHDLGLETIKHYIEAEIFPSKAALITRIGNFGEILATQCLVEAEEYSFPVYKLRFREKRDWAMRLTDLFVVKIPTVGNPTICYGEVKTRSSKRLDRQVAIEAHESLNKDDALEDPQVLKFIRTLLYEKNQLDEARFFQKIQLNRINYDIRYLLFLVHETTTWDEQILAELENHPIDPKLANLGVAVLRINELRQLIDLVYDNAWKGVNALHGEA